MDELKALPKQIRTIEGYAWLTLGANRGRWFAGYFGDSGQPEPAFKAEATSPEEAIAKLSENVALLSLWTADSPQEL